MTRSFIGMGVLVLVLFSTRVGYAQLLETNSALFSISTTVMDAAIGDLNGDGFADVVYALNQGPLVVRYGAAGGQLGDSSVVSAQLNYRSLLSGDFDGDGRSEFIGLRASSTLELFVEEIDGTVSTIALPPPPSAVSHYASAAADLNDDGNLDLVVASSLGTQIWIYSGDGVGGFAAPASVELAPFAPGRGIILPRLSVTDWTGNGLLDLVVISQGALFLVSNFGSGTYVAEELGSSLDLAGLVVASDFTGDGNSDLIVADLERLWLLVGDQSTTLSSPQSIVFAEVNRLELADVDGDGVSEFAYREETGRLVAREGDPTGGFATRIDVPDAFSWGGFAVGDVNGDDLSDFVGDGEAVQRLRLVRSGPAATFVRGDCTNDIAVDVADVIGILGVLFLGDATICPDACDANGDDQLQIDDAIGVIEFLFSGGIAPPAPSLTCGVDPGTVDLLDCFGTPCP